MDDGPFGAAAVVAIILMLLAAAVWLATRVAEALMWVMAAAMVFSQG